MKYFHNLFLKYSLLGLFIFGIFILSSNIAHAFYSITGSTFEARKQEYISDQGRTWESKFPSAIRMPVFAWLEGELQGLAPYSWSGMSRSQLISKVIASLLTEDNCPSPSWRRSCWPGPGEPGGIISSRIYYQYYQNNKVISSQDAEAIRYKLQKNYAESSGVWWCGSANYGFPYLAEAYIYAHRGNLDGKPGYMEYPKVAYTDPPGAEGCLSNFSYNGNSYTPGQSYDAKIIYRDYLEHWIDILMESGDTEDLSPTDYYHNQLLAAMLLVDFAPDKIIKDKATTLLDWLVTKYAVGFSAGQLAGGHGRNYASSEFGGEDPFPFGIFFNYDPDPVTAWYAHTDFYVTSYRPPSVVVNLFEKINGNKKWETDNYYRIIRGDVPALGSGEGRKPSYRYDYITPWYNLGGEGIGTGWVLNVANGEDKPLKLWMNYCDTAVSDCNGSGTPYDTGGYYLFFLGKDGYQHRNAIFYAGGGKLHSSMDVPDYQNKSGWDEQSNESGWQFFRKGIVAVAATVDSNRGALEVATLGVDYPDYKSFKEAIVAPLADGTPRLKNDSFTTSKGVIINKGYVDGKLPFGLLDVFEGHGGGDKPASDEKKVIGSGAISPSLPPNLPPTYTPPTLPPNLPPAVNFPPNAKFKIGDRVRVTSSLNVRSTPSLSGTLITTKAIGTTGTIVSGPTSAGGFNWWQVKYDY